MTSGVLESTSSLETNLRGEEAEENIDLVKGSLDGDTSTEGSTSPDLLLLSNEVPSLNANAPAFTSVSSMTPVLITKNIDIGTERWKPTATIVEENINTIPLATDLQQQQQQPFVGTDGLYYWPADMINSFQPQPVLIESIPNGTATAAVTEQDPTAAAAFSQHMGSGRPDLINQTATIPSNVVIPKDLSHEDLKRLIQHQFEYYFSRENLANDSYLNSQMDGDQYVAISTVAKFNQVRRLTSDISLIVEALKESPYVQLDETEQKVRANMKRCIVILREIPEVTPIEDVKALFAGANCPKWISFEYAYNDSWYVTFECEDDAKRAYRYLREEVQSFQGRPLMARIKAKTLLSRTVFMPKNGNSISTATQPSASSPSESITTHFANAQQPVTTFTMAAHPQVFPQHTFPFYSGPVNGNPGLLPTTWINTRFIQPEMRPKNNYNKYNNYQGTKPMNGQRPYYPGPKPRSFRSNSYNNPKIPFHERNGNTDYEDRSSTNGPSSSTRRSNSASSYNTATNTINNPGVHSNGSLNATGAYRSRDDPRFLRHGGPRKEYRSSSEEGPRFQRLRERRVKDENSPVTKHDKGGPVDGDEVDSQMNGSSSGSGGAELNLDLALENFPALPSPNSPNENLNTSSNRSASSLKELAANALSETDSNIVNDSISPTSTPSSDLATDVVIATPSPVDSESPTTQVNLPTTVAIPTQKILSYAQMAQKPNSNNTKDLSCNDVDFKDITDANIDPKIVTSKTDSKNTNTTQNGNGKTRKATNKGSPRSQRKKMSEKDDPEQIPTSPVLKETYASKFGSATTDAKPTTGGSTSSRPAKTNTNNVASKGPPSLNVNTTLPSQPRPLMSQVISPPASKLDEVNGLQFQQPISFSDTVKKTSDATAASAVASTATTTATTPLSPSKNVDCDEAKPVSVPATDAVVETTVENEKEKLSS